MKKQFTKAFALILMGMFATTTAFAQGKGGHSHTTTDEDPVRGSDWEIFHFPKIDRGTGEPIEEGGKVVFYDRSYYNGGKFDNLSIDKFPGHHWKGNDVAKMTSSNEIYFCNVATGEYLQVGDYWGENSMTNHAGIRYTLDTNGAVYARANWAEFEKQDKTTSGYWICPKLEDSSKEGRCIGRMHVNDGVHGHFEFNRYLALRDKNEYSGGKFPGGFVFQFHPVTTSDGKQAYIIYTHRQTSGGSAPSSEYWDRDSYLLLRSANKEKTGYHTARFRKFAGQMYGRPGSYPAISSWGNDKDKPLGDEQDFVNDDGTPKNNKWGNLVDGNKRVARAAGLQLAAEDPANLWKIVTKEERERFRLVASEDQPVDMTYRIKNPKFYTAYSYTRTLKQESEAGSEDVTPADWDSEHNYYTHANKERDFGWEWFDVDRESHFTNHHIHPWNQHKVGKDSWNPGWFDPENQPKPRQRELHKVGTGDYYRFNTKYVDNHQEEMMLTNGLESNYVGSIWKGTTNLQQTIGTGKPGDPRLREGLYLVAVKGFYAPHDMLKYRKDDSGNYIRDNNEFTATVNTTETCGVTWPWYEEAIVTTEGPDKGKWKRSHDSYLFAWSYPEVVTKRKIATQEDVDAGRAYQVGQDIPDQDPEEVRRMLPSIYEGAVRWDNISSDEKKILSKAYLLEPNNEEFLYTELGYSLSGQRPGHDGDSWKPYTEGLKDDNNIAIYDGNHFSASRPAEWNNSNYNTGTWAVPKSLIGAGHWFNGMEGIDENSTSSYKNLSAYRIALPVYVGPEGILTLGVDHTNRTQAATYTRHYIDPDTEEEKTEEITIPKSNSDEWVCFDDFELIYLGKVEPDEFVIDERHGSNNYQVESRPLTDGTTGEPYTEGENFGKWSNGGEGTSIPNKNNTQWNDIFSETDIATAGEKIHRVKTVVIRRTLKKGGYSSIVVPVNLTKAQVKEGFGEDVRVSKLDDFTGRTIIYKALQNEVGDDDVLMEAGVPYIINPSKDPDVPAPTKVTDPVSGDVSYKVEVTYDRPRFTLAYSTSAKDIAGYYLRDEKRNYEVETSMEGPIYIINDVKIESEVTFPQVVMHEDSPGYYKRNYKSGTDEPGETDKEDNATWSSIDAFDSKTKKKKTYTINRGELKGKKYIMRESAHYNAGTPIPAYSYLWADGKLYYTKDPVPTSRGLYSYLQMVEVDPNTGAETGAFYSKPFIDGADAFIEVFEETSGIEDVNKRIDPDGELQIYDLMGRKVSNPRPGTIYIMNGVKVMWK